MYCSAAGDISKPWWQVSDEGAHEGRLSGMKWKKGGTGLKKEKVYNINLCYFIITIPKFKIFSLKKHKTLLYSLNNLIYEIKRNLKELSLV